jgi:hypothetical protein
MCVTVCQVLNVKTLKVVRSHNPLVCVPQVQREEDRSVTGLLLRTHSAALCLRLATT